jgi:hypothetical protein
MQPKIRSQQSPMLEENQVLHQVLQQPEYMEVQEVIHPGIVREYESSKSGAYVSA